MLSASLNKTFPSLRLISITQLYSGNNIFRDRCFPALVMKLDYFWRTVLNAIDHSCIPPNGRMDELRRTAGECSVIWSNRWWVFGDLVEPLVSVRWSAWSGARTRRRNTSARWAGWTLDDKFVVSLRSRWRDGDAETPVAGSWVTSLWNPLNRPWRVPLPSSLVQCLFINIH